MTADANVARLLDTAARRHPERPALLFEGGEALTFEGLAERSRRLAGGLERLGVGAGDRAVVLIPMSAALYAVLVALLRLAAVAVFVDPWVGRRRMTRMAALAEPRAFVGTPRAHLLRLADRRLRRIPLAVATGRRLGPLPAPVTLDELASAEPLREVAPARPSDSALVTFTTGSSGAPKGADRTHGFLRAQHGALQAELPYSDDDVDLSTFPVFALNNLARGIPTVVPAVDLRRIGETDPSRLLAQMRAHGVTTATASPPLFDRLAEHLETAPGEAPTPRRIVTGGAPVSDRRLHRWRAALPGTEIVVAYGSTEAEPVATIGAEERLALARQEGAGAPAGFCAGRLSSRVEGRLIRIERGPVELGPEGWEGWEVAPGEVGELVVTGEHVCRRYFRSPEATRENKIEGADGRIWHRMGDTGCFDTEERFWLVGRVHSTVVRDGRPVHAQLVEQAAEALDGVRRAAAVGLPDVVLGERLVVVIEGDWSHPDRDRIRFALAAAGHPVDEVRIARRPLPLDPRHASKVDYDAVRRRLASGGERAREPVVEEQR